MYSAELLYRNLKEGERFVDPEPMKVSLKENIPTMQILEAKEKIMIYENEKAPELTVLKTQVSVTKEIWNILKSGIYPPIFHFYSKKGLYVFKIYDRFKERFIIVDGVDGSSLSSLIYKAYTKLHEGNIRGSIEEQMTDLTGKKVITKDITDGKEERKIQWKYLERANTKITACSLDSEGERVYPILDATLINNSKDTGKLRLLKLYGKNPGIEEYGKEDNSFLITYKVWIKNFKKVYTWHNYFKNRPHQFSMWTYNQLLSKTDQEKYIVLTLEETKSKLWIAFTQELPKDLFAASLHKIGFNVYKSDTEETKFKAYEPNRKWQVSGHLNLDGPGEFVIQPVVENQQRDGRFWISVCFTIEDGSKSTATFTYQEAEKLDKKRDQSNIHETLPAGLQEFILRRRHCFFKIY